LRTLRWSVNGILGPHRKATAHHEPCSGISGVLLLIVLLLLLTGRL
jgi:hypothetical protein